MLKRLESMRNESKGLKREVIDTLLNRDDETIKGYINDTIECGCASDTVSELILDINCKDFIERHTEEVNDIYNQVKEYDIDADVDESYLTWISYEITIENLVNEL